LSIWLLLGVVLEEVMLAVAVQGDSELERVFL
jgi:hypothetical protein